MSRGVSKTALAILLVSIAFASCEESGEATFEPESLLPLATRNGASVRQFRGVQFGGLDDAAIERAAAWGTTLARVQIAPNMGDSSLVLYNEAFERDLSEIRRALPTFAANGIKVVLDLHSVPGGEEMFRDETLVARFVEIWSGLAMEFKDNPAVWAYDIANEPPVPEGIDHPHRKWRAIAKQAMIKIRSHDEKTFIVFEAQRGSPMDLIRMKPFRTIRRVIYSFHMYEPLRYTHQGIDEHPFPLAYRDSGWTRSRIRQYFQLVRDWQVENGVRRIYVGEFSAARWAPGAHRYIGDVIRACNRFGWSWTYHAHREANVWDVEFVDTRGCDERANQPTRRQRALVDALGGWIPDSDPGESGEPCSNHPPVADAGPNLEADADRESGLAQVRLDGGGSSDSDGSIVSYTWTLGSRVLAEGKIANVELPIGSHRISLECVDNDGGRDSDETNVLVNPASPQTHVLFSTSFERGSLSSGVWLSRDTDPARGEDTWEISPRRSSDGSRSAHCAARTSRTDGQYSNRMSARMKMVNPIDLRQYRSCKLKFSLWQRVASDGDLFRVDARYGNGSWQTLRTWPGGAEGWRLEELPVASELARFRFVFVSNNSGLEEGVYLDDIQVTGEQ